MTSTKAGASRLDAPQFELFIVPQRHPLFTSKLFPNFLLFEMSMPTIQRRLEDSPELDRCLKRLEEVNSDLSRLAGDVRLSGKDLVEQRAWLEEVGSLKVSVFDPFVVCLN